jgi:hypothetical protein
MSHIFEDLWNSMDEKQMEFGVPRGGALAASSFPAVCFAVHHQAADRNRGRTDDVGRISVRTKNAQR